MNYVGEKPLEHTTLEIFLKEKASFTLIDYKKEIEFRGIRKDKLIEFHIGQSNHEYLLHFNSIAKPQKNFIQWKKYFIYR